MTDHDGHLTWAEQSRDDGGPGPGVRVFRHGSATAVASPGLSGRDRLAVAGDPSDALPLVRDALREVGPTYRPFGDARLIDALVRGTPGLLPGGAGFLWMETATAPGAATGVRWLDPDGERAAGALIDLCFPDSYARPGRPGVRRWAGVHGGEGGGAGGGHASAGDGGTGGAYAGVGGGGAAVVAVAADAWSAAGCGFLAGVVTHPRARGRGLAAAVSAFVVDALVRRHGRAALMVDADNSPAIAVYERAGMRGRRFGAAFVG
ncbi:GNAT family N-acetyltransferase [Streptomyces shenzhenensis]|uniref:GNAT family N-acetyltransferase n=1 Tax=Streptomyces shenzhenensis TaxID=943815 RepID=A0A3M0I5Z5_9ACTN|nr:GNAT family N-acetyltransferase [Streptomyces shenzhenensis]RMB82173.1 GNAT family N-acetyltransferase [Streptomyces shenzhenensis]